MGDQLESMLRDIRTPHKVGGLVVKPSWKVGDFDSHSVDVPYVFFHDGCYYMTFIGWDTIGYRTGLATSCDLLNWSKEGMIIDRGGTGSSTEFNAALTWVLRDNDLLGKGGVLKTDGRFLGTYHAYPNAGHEAGSASIGICWSDDLRNWHLEDFCLHCDDPDAGAWERGGLYKSCILEHEGCYYMFYNAKQVLEGPWNEQIGLAVSRDLVKWQRVTDTPVLGNGESGSWDEVFASDPCVLKCHDKWIMFYFGLSRDGHARDLAAYSDDLVHWTKFDEVLVDVGEPGEVDSTYAHKSSMICRDNVLYHFYCATAPAECPLGDTDYAEIRGITLAVSTHQVALP